MVLVPRLVKNKQWPRMRLLLKSTGPCTPGGRKLQPVPYPIHWSHIAINIEQSLIPLESQVSNVVEYHFFIEHIFFIAWKYQMLSNIYIFSIAWKYKKYRIKCFVLSNIFFLSHETIENIESNVFFYRTYIFFIAWIYWKYRIKLFLSNIIFIEFCYRSAAIAMV